VPVFDTSDPVQRMVNEPWRNTRNDRGRPTSVF
jgi:hypothetical protein